LKISIPCADRGDGARNLTNIRNFVYREPRLAAGFSIEFVVGGATFRGWCRDVSDAGVRCESDDPVVVGSAGLLILRPPTGVLEVKAQVAYVERRQVGLLFVFETSWERTMTMGFIAAIADDAGHSSAVRI
jgi:hypothetical protein